MNKSDVKKGSNLVKVLIGGGVESASIVKVEKVTKDTIFLEGADGRYKRDDSVYAYDLESGRLVTPLIPGFTSRLIFLEED